MNYNYGGRISLGCACQQTPMRGLGAVANYDLIRIGGKDYSAGELQEKAPTIYAQQDTKVYTGSFDSSPVKYITKAGNPLGKYFSYLKPGAGRSQSWLMLEVAPPLDGKPAKYVFVPNEVVGKSAIANQNVKTAQEQIKEEEAAKEKEKDPFGFYFKKYALPILAGGAVIYVLTQFGTTFIKAKVSKSNG